MQDQPRPAPSSPGKRGLDPRRRAIYVGMLMAALVLAILFRPHGEGTSPTQGSDVATLAKLINLPATPIAVRWAVHPLGAAESTRTPGPNDWTLDAMLAFAPADAQRITGVDVFYKSPLLTGKLVRIDDTHFHLVLKTQ